MADFDLREMPADEFQKFIGGLQNQTAIEPRAQAGLNPQTKDALSAINQELAPAINKAFERFISPQGKAFGIRNEAFLDISKGAPKSVRWKLGLDENQLNQFKLLTQIYGPGNVDLSDEGRFILRNQPSATGKPEDIMVDPVGVDTGDIAQMGSQIVPMIAGAVAARFGGRLGSGPVTKVLGATTGMALGQEITGAGQDAFVRWLRDNDVSFTDIARHRAALAVADEVFGLAAAGGAKAMSKAFEGIAGLGGMSVGETATKTAQRALAAKTGVEFPLTPGQETSSRVLQRLESLAGAQPGSSASMDRMFAAQQGAEDELRRVFLGLPREMSDEDLGAILPQADIAGQKGLTRLGTEALRLEGGVAKAGQEIQQTGTKEAQQIAGVNLSKPLNLTDIGSLTRAKVVSDFQKFRSDMGQRYEEFLSNPEITAKTVSGDSLSRGASEIEKKLTPSAIKIKESQSALVDEYGNPQTVTTSESERLDQFIQSKVRGYIDELKGLKGAKVSVNDLKQIRTDIDNSISEGIAIPGVDVKQLISLKGAVDESITGALDKAEDKSLLKTWEQLSRDYSTGRARFDKEGIREMLIKPGESGSVGNTEISESMLGNSPGAVDQYNAMKEFFGPKSAEFQALQAGARQKILSGSISDLSGYIDGAKLRSRLASVRPEIAEELFGANRAELNRIGAALSRAQGKIDTSELGALAESKSLTAAKIGELEAAETERATAYNNQLIRAAAKGSINAEKIKPSEFVRYVTRMDPNDASKVMGLLSDQPELVHEIRQLAIEDVWSNARAGLPGKERISSRALTDAMGTETHQRTWRTILGNDTVDSLETLIKVIEPREYSAKEFVGGGRLKASTEVQKLLMQGEVGTLKEIASRYLLGFLYSGPLKRSITNLATSQDRSRFLNGVIASTPFVEGLMSRYGSDGAFLIMNTLRDAVEPMQRKELAIEGKIKDFDPSKLSTEEFQRWLKNNAGQ